MDAYISAEKVIDAIRHRVCQGNGYKERACQNGSCMYCGIMEIMSDIDSIPPADVKPIRRAKWLHEGFLDMECSNCGCTPDCEQGESPKPTEYCPDCGYYMGDG